MRTAAAAKLFAGAVASLVLLPTAARAEESMYAGRTGLPTVLEGKGNVWIERGSVSLDVRGTNLHVTQSFRLHYPSGKLEKGADRVQVAVREDYFRNKDQGGDVTPSEARGFHSFSARVDGRPVDVSMKEWEINDKKDTATRWRTFWVQFTPGRYHNMTITSSAPLGWRGGSRTVDFVTKDLGGWRDVPDLVEVRLNTPGRSEAKLAGLEPEPENQNASGIRWVYRKVQPKRDIFVILPADYPNRRASR